MNAKCERSEQVGPQAVHLISIARLTEGHRSFPKSSSDGGVR